MSENQVLLLVFGLFVILVSILVFAIYQGVKSDERHMENIKSRIMTICGEPPSKLQPQNDGWWYIVTCPDNSVHIVDQEENKMDTEAAVADVFVTQAKRYSALILDDIAAMKSAIEQIDFDVIPENEAAGLGPNFKNLHTYTGDLRTNLESIAARYPMPIQSSSPTS